MSKKYLITRSQTSLAPQVLTKLLRSEVDFVNLTELKPMHLKQAQIRAIQQADVLALTSGFALQCALPFFENKPHKPRLAVLSTRLQDMAQKAGFENVMVSRSEQQDSLATMLRARLFRDSHILWLRGNLSDRYNPLNLNAPNWRSLVIYKNQVSYLQELRLQQLLRENHYEKILVTSNSAFDRIIETNPKIAATFVSMSFRSAQLIKSKGFFAKAPRSKQQRLNGAIELLLH